MTETNTSYVDTLKEMQECLLDEDLFEQALSLCEKLLNDDNNVMLLPPTLVSILQDTQLKLWLHLERFQQVLESPHVSSSLKSYVKYRNHQYETTTTTENKDVLSLHVQAQSLYRLHQKSALDVYKNLLSLVTDKEEILQIKTNYMAALAAHAVPFCPPTDNFEEAFMQDTSTSEPNSDYLYNRATYDLLTGIDSRFMLQEARRVCQDDDEAAAIDVQWKEWSLLWNGLSPEKQIKDKDLPQAVKTVRDVNRATSLKSLAPKCPSNWTALQQRLYLYKRAILQLQARQYKECSETCQLFLKSLSQSKKNAPPPVTDKEQESWWTSRINVVQAHALYQQDKVQPALDLLRSSLKSLESMMSSPTMDHAVAFTMLHLYALESSNGGGGGGESRQNTVDLLLQLPSSIRSTKAATSTLVALYQELGQVEQATELLQNQEDGMAEYYMSTGNYKEAARLFESTPGKEAELVVALSHVDPIRARQLWDDLNIPKDDAPQELNGEELENMHLPRFKSKKTTVMPTTKAGGKEKRSNESILRRRARKREEYLKNHPNAKKLDPERWLPKHERSYYRKRLGRNARGAQGGGTSNKEAAKLDVAARASGQAVDTGPSTAHIDVSSGSGKRSGRRR